ncbi:MAG: hypothetical protein HKN17_07035, partial [Rhodothermales bacterium]|nr:hypothetical protein [Rhodothermales bacterium]
LEPIDRPGLERLIMQRHRRSGVPVEFLEPPDPSPLLRRRLRTAIGSEQKQRVLREAWFDRLFALTGQDIMMALFYWIRAVEMTESEDRLLIHWFSPIRFDFLAGFSMDQAFALQAILERGLLTVEQHAETNLISRQESHRIMESLGNAMLIEPVVDGPSPTRFDYSAIHGETAYRIRPLVVHPVIRFLRDRNIVH